MVFVPFLWEKSTFSHKSKKATLRAALIIIEIYFMKQNQKTGLLHLQE